MRATVAATTIAVLLSACSSDAPTEPAPPECEGLACLSDIGLVVRKPQVMWNLSKLHWHPGQQIAGPGDTLVVRTLIENRAPTAAPAGGFELKSRALLRTSGWWTDVPAIPAGGTHVVEDAYVVARNTFGAADTLAPSIWLQAPHGLGAEVFEGAVAVPLISRGFKLEFIGQPETLQRGLSTTLHFRISNPFSLPFPASVIEVCPGAYANCLWRSLAAANAPALAPGDSATFSYTLQTDAEPSWAYDWYSQEPMDVLLCVADESNGCDKIVFALTPVWGDRCTIHFLEVPAARSEPFGSWCGGETAYTFYAEAGRSYRARITAGEADLAFATVKGVTDPVYEVWPSDRTFTPSQSGIHYLVVRHEATVSFHLGYAQ